MNPLLIIAGIAAIIAIPCVIIIISGSKPKKPEPEPSWMADWRKVLAKYPEGSTQQWAGVEIRIMRHWDYLDCDNLFEMPSIEYEYNDAIGRIVKGSFTVNHIPFLLK